MKAKLDNYSCPGFWKSDARVKLSLKFAGSSCVPFIFKDTLKYYYLAT